MTRWPLLCALLADPDRESRRLAALLNGWSVTVRRHRIADDRGDADRPLPAGQQQVLEALADRPLRPREIAERTGRTVGAIKFAVGLLAKAGHVERLPSGGYRLASRACEVDE